MDKKNTILGVLLLIGGLGLMMWSSAREAETRRQAAEEAARQPPATAVTPSEEPANGEAAAPATPEMRAASDGPSLGQPVVEATSDLPPAAFATLENEFFIAEFTTHGGALQQITLKEFAEEQGSEERVVLHGRAKVAPLTLVQLNGGVFRPFGLNFEIAEQAEDSVTFTAALPSGLEVRRTYTVTHGTEVSPENYTIRQRLELTNPTEAPFTLNDIYVNIGTAAPTNADPYGFDLNAAYFDDGDYDNIAASKFKGGMFSSAKERVVELGQIEWGAVKNQFFTSILTPGEMAVAIVAEPVRYPKPVEAKNAPMGVTAYLEFALPEVAPGETVALDLEYYSGPKDFKRLSQMGEDQEDVMHLGWFMFFFLSIFAFVGKLLLSLLTFLHGWIGNWGWAIIAMTIIVRMLLWPLTAKAARASKRMQELSKPMQELKEKYKDNPQKMQQATLELFRKHKVNPMSGCWPVLLQFPIFIAMFNLLRNTADLRFAHFLWINDLSMPDATIQLGDMSLPLVGSTINVLPFVWLVSMFFQMKMMPQPSVDNAQVKIIKYMPFIFFPFTYMFSSGLVLYWTTTNTFSIFQGWMTKRKKDAEDLAIEAEIAESEQKKQHKLSSGPLVSKKKKKKDEGRRR
jgi:YidC/Oxa1 family membrane protein insertase